jgi:PilZ domain
MSSKLDDRQELSAGKAIYQLIVEAQSKENKDRRRDVRYAFFRPVSIQLDDGHQYSAFSREISSTGIGLIHNVDLPDRDVDITISSEQGYSIRVRTTIVWCQPCGEGWYISGGKFAGIASVIS